MVTLRAAGLLDVDAGEIVRPGVVRVSEGLISGVGGAASGEVLDLGDLILLPVVVPGDRMLGGPGDGWRVAMDLLPHERSTCFWHRIAYLYARLDLLLASTSSSDDLALGAAYLALHTVRCRSSLTQRRLNSGERLGPETSVDKVLLATAEQGLFDTARDLLPGVVELTDSPWRAGYLYSRAATIYGGTAEIQRNIIARRLLALGRE